jgi:ABC-type glycerol-3-phosphate transport system substrate-binding protein
VEFVDRGEMAPPDDFVTRDTYDLADYIPVSLEQYRWKDRLCALVRDFSRRSLWVNLEAFARERLTPPMGDYSSAREWGFAQFVEAARRLTKTDGGSGSPTPRCGYVVEPGLRGGYGQFIWANGAELFDKNYRSCTVDDERAGEALQLMQDRRDRRRVAPDAATLQERRAVGQPTGSDQLFLEGAAATAIFPATRIGEARRQGKVGWDLAVTPRGKGKRITTGGGGWYLLKALPRQEEAWAVLQHLTSAGTHRLLADVRFPGRRSVPDWWLAQAPDQPPKSRSVPGRAGPHPVPLAAAAPGPRPPRPRPAAPPPRQHVAATAVLTSVYGYGRPRRPRDEPVHDRRSTGRHRRPQATPRCHALSRRSGGRRLGLWHQHPVPPQAR